MNSFLFTFILFLLIAVSLQVFPKKPTISQPTSAVLNNDLQDKPNNLETKTEEDVHLSQQNNYNNKTENKDEKENINTGDINTMHQNEAGTDTDTDSDKTTNIYTPTSNSNNMATVAEKEQINDKRSDNKDVDTETSNEDIGKSNNVESSKSQDEDRDNVAPTRMPTSFISTTAKNEMPLSDSKVEEKTDLDATKPGEISEHQDVSKASDSGRDDKNTENSRTPIVPTSSLSKPSILKDDEDEEDKKDDVEKIENTKTQLPTRGSTKRHGLGLQESLGMLEPTESSLKVQ